MTPQPIDETEKKHYNQAELVELLASANGYSNYLIENGYYKESVCFNLCMVDVINNLGRIKKITFRIGMFYLNAAVAAVNMGDIAAKAFIEYARVDIKKNGWGTINEKKFNEICQKIATMPENNGIKYIS
jgi:hypothetical protein